MDEQQALDALNRFDENLGGAAGLQMDRSAAAAEGLVDDACAFYRQNRHYLEGALWLVERVPVYGAKIARALRLVMQIADRYCGQ